MGKLLIVFLMLCSFLMADTGWKTPVTLIEDQPANDEENNHLLDYIFLSHVDNNGIHIFYRDIISTVPMWIVKTFEMDGSTKHVLYITYDTIEEVGMDGNDEALFVVWAYTDTDEDPDETFIGINVSTDGGDNWDLYYKEIEGYGNGENARTHEVSAECDDDGLHIAVKVVGDQTGLDYIFVPNDIDSNNDLVYESDIPGSVGYISPSNCDGKGSAIYAINDYGTSSYDNIMLLYQNTDSPKPVDGQISIDDGDTWGYDDEILTTPYTPTGGAISHMDMTCTSSGDFIAAMSIDATNDSLKYSYRLAKGSSSYSETWSTPILIPITNFMVTADFDMDKSVFNGYVDMAYNTTSQLKYRLMTKTNYGTEETAHTSTGFYPDVTNNWDTFIVHRTNGKDGVGDIVFSIKDYQPPAFVIEKHYNGDDNPEITWEKPCLDVEEYNIYRKIDSGSYSLLATTSNLYYEDGDYYYDGPHPDDPYVTLRYRVAAVDYDDNESALSNEIYYSRMILTKPLAGGLIPTEYALHDAYPNPFNPTTTIRFDLPKEDYVNITIFDINAKNVMTLVDTNLQAGKHEAVLDGKDLSSGMYFVVMTTSEFGKLQKILLIK